MNKIKLKVVVYIIMMILVKPHFSLSEDGRNCSAISTDSISIFKTNLDNRHWEKDEKWHGGKYVRPSISPSGRYLSYIKFIEKGFCIIDSSNKKEIFQRIDENKNIEFLSWHPKEKYIAILEKEKKDDNVYTGNICLYTISNKQIKDIYSGANILDYPSPPSWNNTGDKLYFINKDSMVIEFDFETNSSIEIVSGKGVHWISETELLVRNEKNEYHLYDQKLKKEKYMFKLGMWQYPPIFLSPDKTKFLVWDTKPRKLSLSEQWYTTVRLYPSGKHSKVIPNYGANWFSWSCGEK